MAFEDASYIWELVASNPPGTDPLSEGDNHIRSVKLSLLQSFPNMTAPWVTTYPIQGGAAVTDDQMPNLSQVKALTTTISYGQIQGNGNISGGSGDFTVSKTGQGAYILTFDTPPKNNDRFQQAMSATGSGVAQFSNNFCVNIFSISGSPSQLGVNITSGPSSLVDYPFTFMRIVPA
jgi:hypothetical protein